jgi:S-layer protein (TIGR01567 family)
MSFRKQLIIGTFVAIATLLIWSVSTENNQSNVDNSRVNNSTQPDETGKRGASLITENNQSNVDNSRVNNSTRPNETDKISIPEKPFRIPFSTPGSHHIWATDAGDSTFNLTPMNFDGFYSGNYSEMLEITNLSDRTIPVHGLKYTAFVTEIPYAVTKKTGIKPSGTNGSYKAVVFGSNKYTTIGKSSLLAQILIDNGTNAYEKKTLVEGEIWKLGEDYNLTVRSINILSREVCFVFSKNRVPLNEKCLLQGYIYSYTTTSSRESDPPLFFTYLDAILTGDDDDLIFLKYTWFRSNNITEIHEGDRFGVFRVTSVESDFIELKNDIAINLSAGSCINLIGNLSFTVTDSDELRFYPTRGKKCGQSG